MADIKISQLPSATSVTTSTVIPVVQGGTTEQATLAQVSAAIGGGSSTGDWSFTGNTASLPFNANAIISTSGNTTVMVPTTSSYDSTAWDNGTALNLISVSGNDYYFAYTTYGYQSWFDIMSNVVVGSTLIFNDYYGSPTVGTVTSVVTGPVEVQVFFTETGGSPPATLPPSSITELTANFPTVQPVSGVYTFEKDGTFMSNTVLAGELYISNNIITPLPATNVYGGCGGAQPVLINGDLSVIGTVAGSNFNSPGSKIAIGSTAASIVNQAANAIAIGNSAGLTGQCEAVIAIGAQAGYNAQGYGAIAVGFQAGQSVQAAQGIAVGFQAGQISQQPGAIAIGALAGFSHQGGIAIGIQAGLADQNTTGTAIGGYAGSTNQASGGVAVGYSAGTCGQSQGAVAVGYQAGALTQQQNAVAVGWQAGQSGQQGAAVAIGQCAGNHNQQTQAIAIGLNAGQSQQGSQAVAIGVNAGLSSQADNTIIINASGAEVNGVPAQTNSFYVAPIRNATGGAYLGYNSTTKEVTYSTGAPSDISLKENIQVIGCALNKTSQARGVTFNWKACGRKEIGVIAQEIEQVFPELVTLEGDGLKSVKYENLTAVLLEAVKELKTRVETLEEIIKKNNLQ